jgi:hypothetical protein
MIPPSGLSKPARRGKSSAQTKALAKTKFSLDFGPEFGGKSQLQHREFPQLRLVPSPAPGGVLHLRVSCIHWFVARRGDRAARLSTLPRKVIRVERLEQSIGRASVSRSQGARSGTGDVLHERPLFGVWRTRSGSLQRGMSIRSAWLTHPPSQLAPCTRRPQHNRCLPPGKRYMVRAERTRRS